MWERGGAEEEWNNGGSSGRRRSTEELAGGRRGAKLRSLQRREMAETRSAVEQRRSAVWHVSDMSGEAVLGLIELSRTMGWAKY
jgi:hypothetical protein